MDDIGKASDAELSSHQAMIQVCANTATSPRPNPIAELVASGGWT